MSKAESQRKYIAKIRQHPIDPDRHGHISTYTNFGCRCEACRHANHEYMRAYRARARQALN